MNFIGVDVSAMDIDRFQAGVRVVFVLVYLAWVFTLANETRRLSLWGPLALTLVCWFMTTFPLQGLYGLALGTDRMRHLWWCAAVSAGQPMWESGVLDRSSLEPVWSLFVSLLALRDPARVIAIYPFLSALALALTGVAVVVSFRTAGASWAPEQARAEARWRSALLVGFFVLLASTGPLDFLNPYRGFWAKSFLLKPNHAMGFALVPLALALLARELSWWRAVAAAALIGLLGWVFITHWFLLCSGVFLYAASTFVLDASARRDSLRLVGVLAGSAIVVAPYVFYLVLDFPETVNFDPSPFADAPTRSIWGDSLPANHSLFFLVTLELGAPFYLALYGLWVAWARGGRFERLWASVVVGVYAAWAVNGLLLLTGRARQTDDMYYFLVFAVAVQAGLGAARLSETIAEILGRVGGFRLERFTEPRRVIAAGLVVWLPLTLGWWWDPMRMDAHFQLGLAPVPRTAVELGKWVVDNTESTDVFIAEAETGHWIPAMSGRRIVFASHADEVRGALEAHRVDYAVVDRNLGPEDREQHDALMRALESAGTVEPVRELGPVIVYAIRYRPVTP